jgi:tetratricopeptide (TPR) repeat protein
MYVKGKQYNKAVEQYRTALKISPTSSTLYYNMGNVLMAQKDYRGAMDAYVGYIENDPDGKYAESIRTKIEDLRFRIMTQE